MLYEKITCDSFYLNSLRKTSLVEKEKEQELFKLYAIGDKNARNEIIKANIRFVVKVALQYRTKTFQLSDLVSEGVCGLVRAIDSFEPSRGLKFISYAVWWIRAYINRAIYEKDPLVKIPQNKKNEIAKCIRNNEKLDDDLEILKSHNDFHIPLDSKINVFSKNTYSDILKNEKEDFNEESDNIGVDVFLKDIVSELDKREAKAISRIFGLENGFPMTLREVANDMNLSRERIRQLKEIGLKKIRKKHLRILKESFVS